MPVFMWSEHASEDELSEFDSCSLCLRVTSLLIYVRFREDLIGICGACVNSIDLAYREMMRRRVANGSAGKLTLACEHWHVSRPSGKQPGACWRCKCDDLDNDDACSCCHVEPCEMER